MDAKLLERLNAERRARRAVVLVTEVTSAESRLVLEGEEVSAVLAEPVSRALRSGNSVMIEAEGRSYFLNVHLPRPRLVIVGAVHISQALAPMARIAGYPVEIIDPRTAFATEDRFPEGMIDARWPEDVLAERPLDAYTALAVVTHDPKIDDFPLKAALDAGCFYVGALGSRKTHAARLERLLALGATEAQVARISAPIGLDIGAANPAEIAVAVLAQVIDAFRARGQAAAGQGKAR